MNTRNSHVHDHFRELANIICPVREPSSKEYLKTEIKAKILALPNELDKIPLLGARIAIERGYDLDSVIGMIKKDLQQDPSDTVKMYGQEIIDLINKYTL